MLKLQHSTLFIFILAAAINSYAQNHRHYEFIPNKGQENSSVNYSVKLKGGKMFVQDKSLLFNFVDNSAIAEAHHAQKISNTGIKAHAYEMKWVNAQKPSYVETNKTKHYYNYFC